MVNKCTSRTPDAAPGFRFLANRRQTRRAVLPALFLIVFFLSLVLLHLLDP